MANANPTGERWRFGWGVLTGFVVGVFLFLPITFTVRNIFDVPVPDPVPPLVLWDGLYKAAPSYWISSAAGLLLCLVPALACVAFHRSRRFGLGYALAVISICLSAAAAVASYDIGGQVTPG